MKKKKKIQIRKSGLEVSFGVALSRGDKGYEGTYWHWGKEEDIYINFFPNMHSK